MLSKLIRQGLFNFLHFLVNVLVAVHCLIRAFSIKIYSYYSVSTPENELKLVLECSPHVRKKLNHLVLMCDDHNQSLYDLARLVIWSLVAGVPYVSLYDSTGNLSKNEEKLFLEVEKLKKGVPGYIKWSNKTNLNGYSNGIQANKITVNIFTSNDGHSKIAQCIKKIGLKQIPCNRDSSYFTAEELNNAIHSVYPLMPDPDLVMYVGPLCCTNGLLPWHIRLTEFVQLSVDKHFTVYDYISALYKFSKCDQRFGK